MESENLGKDSKDSVFSLPTPFPDFSDYLVRGVDEKLKPDPFELNPVDFEDAFCFDTVDLDEPFKRVIEKRVPISDLFEYDFTFDPKTGNAKSLSVKPKQKEKRAPNRSESVLVDPASNLLSKLDFLGIEETFDDTGSALPFPTDLKEFVDKNFPLNIDHLLPKENIVIDLDDSKTTPKISLGHELSLRSNSAKSKIFQTSYS